MALARAKTATLNRPAADTAVLAALTAWFASKAAIAATGLPDTLLELLTNLGIDRQVAVAVGEMATVKALSGRSRHGAPAPTGDMTLARRVAIEEPEMRARYVLAAARRLTEALLLDRYGAAWALEQRYLAMHIKAGQNRRAAARRVDKLGSDGQVLVWRTAGDDRVTPDCAALEGRLFQASNPPGIPGAMHMLCRCHAELWGHGPLLNWGSFSR